jgi:hypothetical protein
MRNLIDFSRRILSTKPSAHDFVGYEVLLDFIRQRALHRLEGDLVEIGVLMGGGTVKLARFARKYHKKVYAVDIFDPSADKTATPDGIRMSDIYEAFLQGRSQIEVYEEAVRGLDNIVTIKEDSKKVRFPGEQKFMFGFIDGNHQPEYVRNDFDIVWSNLVPNGVVGFHDYRSELAEVTETIDGLIAEHKGEISDTHQIKEKNIILLTKRQGG